MQNYKLFLAGTTLFLTTAGVIAKGTAKGNHHFSGWTKSNGPDACHQLSVQLTATKMSGTAILRTDALTQTIFTSQSCSTPLYTATDNFSA